MGGDEFAILVPATTSKEAVAAVDRLRTQISSVHPAGLALAITFGVSSTDEESCADADSLLLAADRALYSGKAQRGNRTVLYEARMRAAGLPDRPRL